MPQPGCVVLQNGGNSQSIQPHENSFWGPCWHEDTSFESPFYRVRSCFLPAPSGARMHRTTVLSASPSEGGNCKDQCRPRARPYTDSSLDLLTLCGDILKERHFAPYFLHKVSVCLGLGNPIQNDPCGLYIKLSGILV